jgi:hypothetical protein
VKNIYALGYVFLALVLIQSVLVKLNVASLIQKIYFLVALIAFLVLAFI